VVRYQVAQGGVEPVTGAVEKAFSAVAEAKPKGIRYSYYRIAGKPEFLAILELPDGADNPLLGIEGARELQATVAKWAEGATPTPEPLQVIGTYGFDR
jgi:hypothetical protein